MGDGLHQQYKNCEQSKKCFFYFFTRDVQCNKTFLFANRLFILNDQIPIQWLDGGYEMFKVKCKKLMVEQ